MPRLILKKLAWPLILWGLFGGLACWWAKKPLLYPSGPFFPLQIKNRVNFSGPPLKYLARAGDYLFWTTLKGELLAYSLSQKKIVWRASFPPSPFGQVSLFKNYLYWGDGKGQVRCYSQQGEQIWLNKLGKKITSCLFVSDQYVGGVVDEYQLFALNRKNGQLLWQYKSPEKIISGPACGEKQLVFGGEQGTLFVLDLAGRPRLSFPLGKQINPGILLEQNRCYFSTKDNDYYAFDLFRGKIAWKITLGGESLTGPLLWEKKLIIPLWSGVLFCLKKKSGEIIWWQPLPGRSDFQPGVAEDQILVASLSSSLVSFRLKDGQLKGTSDLKNYTLRSNPVWVNPFIYLLASEKQTGEFFLLEMTKEVKVILLAEPPAPRAPGEEIKFRAEVTGFYQPEFEFYLGQKSEEGPAELKVQKPFSTENIWIWYPEKPGKYLIRVKVKDLKEEAQAELEYIIQEEKSKEATNKKKIIEEYKRN